MSKYAITGGVRPTALKTVVYGPEGIGKTTFASCFPKAVFIDTEGSTKFFDLARFPVPTSWTMLLDEVQEVINDPTVCDTLVIDTADWAENGWIIRWPIFKCWSGRLTETSMRACWAKTRLSLRFQTVRFCFRHPQKDICPFLLWADRRKGLT